MDEKDLIKAAKSGDEKAKIELITSNMKLILSVCKKLNINKSSYEDAIQEGTVGLIEAINNFNLNKINTFSTYAYYFVQNKIIRNIINKDRLVSIPSHINEKWIKNKNIEKPVHLLNSISLDNNYVVDNEEFSLISTLKSEEINPKDEAIKNIENEKIISLLKKLNKRSRKIIIYRIVYKYSFSKIGKVLNISKEGARKNYNKSISFLKESVK